METIGAVRAGLGLALETGWSTAAVSGEDRVDFLQRQLPADVTALRTGEGTHTALLDRRGRVLAHFLLLSLPDAFLILAQRDLIPVLLERLETVHFGEVLELEDLSQHHRVMQLHGPAVPGVLARLSAGPVPQHLYGHASIRIAGSDCRWVAHPLTGDPGGHLIAPAAAVEGIAAAARDVGDPKGLVEVDAAALEVLRVEGGWPRYGVDVDAGILLPELGCEEGMICFDKGCYPGQEVVARIRSRGHVNRVLAGLRIEGAIPPTPGTEVLNGTERVGETRSAVYSPTLGRAIALAYLRTASAGRGTVLGLRIQDETITAEVAALPFHTTPSPMERADVLYREGMNAFTDDRIEDALASFRSATEFGPGHLDAFEALGVCYDRLGDLNAAVETMRTLLEMDPDNVMAWSNLSRFYGRMGRMGDAEEALARSTRLAMEQRLGVRAARRPAEVDEAERRGRLQARLQTFRQVLELDPADPIANLGLGKILLDLDRPQEAEPPLRRAVEAQPDHSMAYSHLGACLQAVGQAREAAKVLRRGIEVAAGRGDLMPQRDMERRLRDLEETGSLSG